MSYIQYGGMVLFFALIIGTPLWTVYRRGKLKDITQNKVLAIILTRVGNMWWELCPYENETAKITKDGEPEAGAVALNKENTFDTLYPPTLHKVGKAAKTSFITEFFRPTVSIRAVIVPEGQAVGYRPWIDDVEDSRAMLDRQLAGIDDQVGEKLLRATEQSLKSSNVGEGLKKSDKTLALIIGLIILVVSGVSAFFGYAIYAEVTSWGW